MAGMREILRTNDPVLLSFAVSLFSEADIPHMVADQNMSVMEGSIGILPRRLLVADDHMAQARRILTDADLGKWIRDDGR